MIAIESSALGIRLTELGAREATIAILSAYGVKNVADLAGRGRHKPVAGARHELQAWLYRHVPHLSYPDVGAMFGRDHTTIIAACDKVERLIFERVPGVAERQAIPREDR